MMAVLAVIQTVVMVQEVAVLQAHMALARMAVTLVARALVQAAVLMEAQLGRCHLLVEMAAIRVAPAAVPFQVGPVL